MVTIMSVSYFQEEGKDGVSSIFPSVYIIHSQIPNMMLQNMLSSMLQNIHTHFKLYWDLAWDISID